MPGTDAQALSRVLALRTTLPANWCDGLRQAGELGVFVSPPVSGHVFAIGADLSLAPQAALPALVQRLERLSATFGRAAWFTTFDDAEVHGWLFAERGELRRGYVFSAAAGHVFWHGDPTDAERTLGCFVDDPRDTSDDEVKWWPDTDVVCRLAATSSLDPRRLAECAAPPATGWYGRL